MNNSGVWQRYVPLACWLAGLLVTVFICLKVLGYGYMPPGDARRHVARPFAQKPYSEIVVMRPQYVVDHSPGWEWLLGALHRVAGLGRGCVAELFGHQHGAGDSVFSDVLDAASRGVARGGAGAN